MYFFSDLLWTNPAIVVINIAPFYCLTMARVVVSTVVKKIYNPFEDLHLSMPLILTLISFPVNKLLGLGIDERWMFALSLATNLFVYFIYVINTIN